MPTATPPSRDVAIETRVFWERFKKEIAAALLILLLGVIAFAGYRFYTDRRVAAASALLAIAKTAQEYQQLIDRYPNTAAAADAYILLAEAQRKEKKFAEANTTLQTFIDTGFQIIRPPVRHPGTGTGSRQAALCRDHEPFRIRVQRFSN